LVEFGDAFLGARLFAIERFPRRNDSLCGGCRLGFRVAQRRQRRGGQRLPLGGFRLGAGALGEHPDADVLGVLRLVDLGGGVDEAQMKQRGLGLAHLLRERAIAHGLSRLALQGVDLGRKLTDDILKPREVLLRRAQPKLGFMPTRVQPGDARGLLKHPPPLLGLGLDDFPDTALMHEGRGSRAGRGVREQNVDVACAHLAAIDAIVRAFVTLDAARHFERLLAVELRGRAAIGIVDPHRDFGHVARRPAVVAGKDHVVHVGGAHGLVRRLAHHPA